MSSVVLFAVGTTVTIGGHIDATITGVMIGPSLSVSYECAWWDGRSRTTAWLKQNEVSRKDESTMPLSIGFAHP